MPGASPTASAILPQGRLRWLAGESLVKRFAVCFCTQCGTGVPSFVETTALPKHEEYAK